MNRTAHTGKNVIVIVNDSLRADHLGCYGSHVKTPNIDRLAQEAALFEQAYSENLPTMPCRTAWWTGQYLFTQRGWQWMEVYDYLLAEILWDRGMTSALISDVYHMHKPGFNCGRGFDTVIWVRGQEYDPWIVDQSIPVDLSRHRLRGDKQDGMWKARFEQYLRNVRGYKTDEDSFVARTVKEAIRWLDQVTKTQKDNLFLWVDCFDPHEPWDPPAPFDAMYDPGYTGQELIDPVPGPVEGYMTPEEVKHTKALYAGEVTMCDKWVGILLDHLRDLGVYDNSLIIYTSDHGEPFGEHGIIRKARPWNYEELAHIPWIIRHPEGVGAGKRIPAFVQPPDLLPTILDFLGISGPLERPAAPPPKKPGTSQSREVELDGLTLLPLIRGEIDKIRDFAVTAHHNQQWAIRTDDWTYLYELKADRPNELYHRKSDPQEQKNVIADQPEVARELERKLLDFAQQVKS